MIFRESEGRAGELDEVGGGGGYGKPKGERWGRDSDASGGLALNPAGLLDILLLRYANHVYPSAAFLQNENVKKGREKKATTNVGFVNLNCRFPSCRKPSGHLALSASSEKRSVVDSGGAE